MNAAVWVFLGGGLGSVARYLVSKQFNLEHFGYGTFIANFLASLILGYVVSKTIGNTNYLKPLLAIGFCGGFSTFSTFSLENFNLLNQGNYGLAIANILLNVLLCIAAIAIGFYLSNI